MVSADGLDVVSPAAKLFQQRRNHCRRSAPRWRHSAQQQESPSDRGDPTDGRRRGHVYSAVRCGAGEQRCLTWIAQPPLGRAWKDVVGRAGEVLQASPAATGGQGRRAVGLRSLVGLLVGAHGTSCRSARERRRAGTGAPTAVGSVNKASYQEERSPYRQQVTRRRPTNQLTADRRRSTHAVHTAGARLHQNERRDRADR